MKIAALSMFSMLLILPAAHAAREFDCPPTPEVQSQQRNEAPLSEHLTEKRKQAREADLARLKERFMRSASTQTVAATAQPTAQ